MHCSSKWLLSSASELHKTQLVLELSRKPMWASFAFVLILPSNANQVNNSIWWGTRPRHRPMIVSSWSGGYDLASSKLKDLTVNLPFLWGVQINESRPAGDRVARSSMSSSLSLSWMSCGLMSRFHWRLHLQECPSQNPHENTRELGGVRILKSRGHNVFRVCSPIHRSC